MKYFLSISLLAAAFASLTSFNTSPIADGDDAEWKLAKKKNGVFVFTRKNETSDIKEFRTVMDIKTSLNFLTSLIDKVDDHPDWQENLTTAEVIKRVSSTQKYIYYTSLMPWPVKNRDVIVLSTKKELKGKVHYTMDAAPDEMEDKDGFIRLRKSKGRWLLSEKEDGTIRVVHQFAGDPGGNIPAWLINMMIVDGPYDTFMNIQKLNKAHQERNK